MLHSIVIEINTDPAALMNITGSHLASAWHVAQANPAAYGDNNASLLVQALGDEIVRRWLAAAPADQFSHQAVDQYRHCIAKAHPITNLKEQP